MSASSPMNRRSMFKALLNPLRALSAEAEASEAATETEPITAEVSPEPVERVAVIQGRFCLAYQKSFCSNCHERCPEEGAIQVKMGIPTVVADLCTGCGVCHEVCPAPRNAVLMMKKNPQPRTASNG